MLNIPQNVFLFEVAGHRTVQTPLVELDPSLAQSQIDSAWWTIPVRSDKLQREDDSHWNWQDLADSCQTQLAWDAVAIQTPGGQVEGAMTFRIDAESLLENGKGVVYIDRLAAAPHNRPWLVDTPRYRGVGTALVLVVVQESYKLGLEGRVGLSSLPSPRTRDFYQNRGFQEISQQANGLFDLELPAVSAENWLRQEGLL